MPLSFQTLTQDERCAQWNALSVSVNDLADQFIAELELELAKEQQRKYRALELISSQNSSHEVG